MSSRLREYAGHIVENIDRICGYVGLPPDPERLEQPMVRDAVERCLERISEAVSRLHRAGAPLQDLAPDIPGSISALSAISSGTTTTASIPTWCATP
jgi:uncharacterized protein with HEPN domain